VPENDTSDSAVPAISGYAAMLIYSILETGREGWENSLTENSIRGLGTGETVLDTAAIKECSDAFQRHSPSYYNNINFPLGLARIREEDFDF